MQHFDLNGFIHINILIQGFKRPTWAQNIEEYFGIIRCYKGHIYLGSIRRQMKKKSHTLETGEMLLSLLILKLHLLVHLSVFPFFFSQLCVPAVGKSRAWPPNGSPASPRLKFTPVMLDLPQLSSSLLVLDSTLHCSATSTIVHYFPLCCFWMSAFRGKQFGAKFKKWCF